MSGFGMVPLNIRLIDEGEFAQQIETALADAQVIIANHRERHGDASHKASVVVDAKIELTILDAAEGMTGIKTSVDIKHPKSPKRSTTAMESTDQTGRPALFVKAGGSDSDDPRQLKFANRDGSMVEPSGDGEYEDVDD